MDRQPETRPAGRFRKLPCWILRERDADHYTFFSKTVVGVDDDDDEKRGK